MRAAKSLSTFVAADRATYADAAVVCGALELDPSDKTSAIGCRLPVSEVYEMLP
jgi:hypothetical protein